MIQQLFGQTLRTPVKLTAPISIWSRADSVVPFGMEFIALDVEHLHLSIADFDALIVSRGIERALDFQAGFGRGRSNQLDHGHAIDEWSPAPSLRDVAEQAVLDLIPLRRARRIVMDVEHEARLVGELLQLDLPQPDTRSIRAAAIGRDGNSRAFG